MRVPAKSFAVRIHRHVPGGLPLSTFYRATSRLALDLDVALSQAWLQDVPAEADYIPGALENVVGAGVSFGDLQQPGVTSALRVRHFGAYPLIEDNSVRADPVTLVNASVGYQFTGGVRLSVSLLNAFDAEASDIQYFYESRLAGEPAAGVADLHFHPAEPRQLRSALEWSF